MRRIKRLLSVVSAGILSMSSLFVLVAPIAHAAADTCTWTGLANSNFSDAGNWTCSLDTLELGDDLVFPSIVTNRNITMDVAYSVADVDFNGDMTVPCGSAGYVISGSNALTVTGLINLNHTGTCVSGAEQTITAPFIVGGNIVLDGSLSTVSESFDLGGSTVTGSGSLIARDSLLSVENINSSVALGIEDGAELSYTVASCLSAVISSTVSLANSASLTVQDSSDDCEDVTITNAALSVNSDFAAGYRTVTITNLTAGGYVLTVTDGSATTVVADGDTIVGDYIDTSYSANTPLVAVNASEKVRATVTGTYGSAFISKGAYLKGTGTFTTSVNVAAGAFLSPGMSPGCLATGNLTLAGTYEAEVQGATACSGYDQVNVTGTVSLNGAILTTATSAFVPTVGQTYTIINNDLAEAVTGTFTGLAEGATIVDGGVTYTISYIGGDGNDVVLTVTAVDASAIPGAPNTGFAILTSNPLATLLGGLLAAAGFGLLARRQFAREQ